MGFNCISYCLFTFFLFFIVWLLRQEDYVRKCGSEYGICCLPTEMRFYRTDLEMLYLYLYHLCQISQTLARNNLKLDKVSEGFLSTF